MAAGNLSRRHFLQTGAVAAMACAAGTSASMGQAKTSPRFKKAVKYHMVTDKSLSIAEKFSLLKGIGYDGVEIRTADKDSAKVKELLQARDKTELPIHGIINSNNPDIKTAIDLSKTLGGTSVLVVAGRVSKEVSYDDNYKEWSNRIKENAPHAEKQGIQLLVENVWNNFLLSPLEMAQFIDEINSPAVGVYFDVGNVVRFGYPEQWIRILGKRIGKLDIKEYSRKLQKDEGLWKGFNVEIGDGDSDYPAVVDALEEIGYSGWATAEVKGGDKARLTEIADRMDKVLELK
ncbi:sugar phosphate isomerase/epimerase family protein [Thalassoglobus polymorphus]|uniref:Xylose isomerase-like TIM barrel n=1 Tax=Thalassoglobus polymorphus TaxID=2527994 RepID=A0A517QQD5_9PLAN|nr:sugar phosphate isomerase/epimerase family protein [Thalassoglobus polymorphus]QDT33817.1 Xylose isomerase-like TIM barrel [Thalassoglobus polymorphus]